MKNRQNNGADKDPTFIKDLQKVEDLYKSLVYRTGNRISPSKSDKTFAVLNVTNSSGINETTRTPFTGDAFSNRFSAFDPATQRAGNSNYGTAKTTSRNNNQDYKNGPDKITQLLEDGNQTLHDLQFKFANGNRISYPHSNPAFDRGVSDEELQLKEYEEREKELLKNLSSLPSGSRLYQDALHQIKELALLKNELEKIIKEQKLSRNMQQQVQIRPQVTNL